MTRLLLSSSALALFLSTAVLAQGTAAPSTNAPAAPMVPQTEASFAFSPELTSEQLLWQDLLGTSLDLAAGETAGTVDDLIVRADGTIAAYVVTTAPEIAPQTRRIAIASDRVRIEPGDGTDSRVQFDGTATDLAAAPALAIGSPEIEGDAAAVGTTVEPMAAPNADVPSTPAPAQPEMPSSFLTELEPETFLASDLLSQSVHAGAAADSARIGQIDGLVIGRGGTLDAVLVAVGGFLGIGEKTVGVPFEAVALSRPEPGVTHASLAVTRSDLEAAPAFALADGTVASVASALSSAPDATGARVAPDTTAAGTAQPSVPLSELSATDLLDEAIRGPEGERIGEISEVVIADDGTLDAVVVDVGGFLGIGEKQVAVALENLTVAADGSISTSFTRAELEAAPTFGVTEDSDTPRP